MSNFIPRETKRITSRDPPCITKILKTMLNRNKCFAKRVSKRIRNLQAKVINTRMTSFWMYVSAAAILVGPNTRKSLRDLTKRKLLLKPVYMYTILLFLNLIPLRRYMLTSINNCEIYRHVITRMSSKSVKVRHQ